MSSLSPASVLYSSDGYELAVVQNTTIPAGTRMILTSGSDGTNARPILVDASGRPVIVGAGIAGTPAGGVVTIQGVSGGVTIPVSGTVTAVNASVSTTGSSPPASATYIGGSVTTAAPAYTTGQMSALSLTTTGLLRVDGSGVTQPVSGTVTANAGSGNFTVVQATAASLNATIVGTTAAGSGASSGLITVQGNASGTPIPVSGFVTTNKATTSSITTVSVSSSVSTQLLAPNTNRVFASIYNNTAQQLFLKLGSTASSTSFSELVMPNSYFEIPNDWTGEIDALAKTGTAATVLVTELTP